MSTNNAVPGLRRFVVYGYPRPVSDWVSASVSRAQVGRHLVRHDQLVLIYPNERNGSIRLRGLGHETGIVLLSELAHSADEHLAGAIAALRQARAVDLWRRWCPVCVGPVHADHGPYLDDAGERICAICNARRNPVLNDAITGALNRLTGR